MKIIKKKIGQIKNKKIYSIELINDNNFRLKFLNFGCYITNIIIPYNNKAKDEDVVLGYENFKDFLKDKDYLNCVIGRVAGRISDSKFKLNNIVYKLFKNEKINHLHGGKEGFNKKFWEIKSLKKNKNLAQCVFHYNSPHLEEQYPGNINCNIKYKLDNRNRITIEFNAKSDRDTILNLTNHNYWNFNGHKNFYSNISNHKVSIYADKFLKKNKNLIPRKKISNLKGTKFDYRLSKEIGKNILKKGGVDNYFINKKSQKKLKKISEVFSPKTKMGMVLFSNQPGIQFYTGNNMKYNYKGKNNRKYGKNFGLCFEPQKYPNAINTKSFPSIVLKKDKRYKSHIVFCLKNNFDQ